MILSTDGLPQYVELAFARIAIDYSGQTSADMDLAWRIIFGPEEHVVATSRSHQAITLHDAEINPWVRKKHL